MQEMQEAEDAEGYELRRNRANEHRKRGQCEQRRPKRPIRAPSGSSNEFVTDRPTNQSINRPTDRQTQPLIDVRWRT